MFCFVFCFRNLILKEQALNMSPDKVLLILAIFRETGLIISLLLLAMRKYIQSCFFSWDLNILFLKRGKNFIFSLNNILTHPERETEVGHRINTGRLFFLHLFYPSPRFLTHNNSNTYLWVRWISLIEEFKTWCFSWLK